MRIRAFFTLLLLPVILAVFPFSAHAQVATGSPPFASLGGGPFDSVNLANLNVHFGIPVVNKAGRAIPFTYTLEYNSAVWNPVTSGSSKVWTPVASFGWAGPTQSTTGSLGYVSGQTKCFVDGGQWYFAPTYNGFGYVDTFGAVHSFPTGLVGGCNGSGNIPVAATDGSGYTLQSISSVTSSSGQTINPPVNTTGGSANKFDSNGNEITVSGSTFTDTLGTTALTISGQGTHTSPLQFQYTAPNGNTVSVALNYTTYNVKTAFGCSGITEYNQSIDLVTSVSLPDGTSYSITYEPTPNNSGYVTGRIKSIQLPTGGTITYSYSDGSNGITCADGTTATLTRQTPDGTWKYQHTESGTAWTTVITDPTPQQNQTSMSFQGIYETERQVFQGSSTSGTLLKTVITCYNGNTSNCNTTVINQPITQITATFQWPGGKQSKVNTLYNSLGLVTEDDEYDYGTGGPGALLRQTLTTYATLGNIISDRPATITVKDALGNVNAQTTFSYDQTAVVATTGTPQQIAVGSIRGNPTTTTSWIKGSTSLSKSNSYYDTGTVQTTTDANGAQTIFTYGAGSCGNSYVTSVALPLNLSRSQTWDCTGGVVTSATDENGKVITYAYAPDPAYWRVNSITDPGPNVTNFTYSGALSAESSLIFNGTSSTVDVLNTFDLLGRIRVAQRKQSPSSSSYDSRETDYDSAGRPQRVTQPYSGTFGQTNSTAPATTVAYDALGRELQRIDAGGGSTTTSYTQNDVLTTLGPAPTGESIKRRQSEYDGIGRLTSVCEITSATGSGSCAQTTSQTGFWTKYTYDAAGDLLSVIQNAQSGTNQSRSYTYDGLGRLLSETNPESGLTQYFYDSDPGTVGTSCPGTYNGDLVKRYDAVGNTTCYSYDALHGLTSITYSGPYSSVTPNKYLVYDAATVNGQTMQNAKNRLAEAYTATCQFCNKITDLGFSYTALSQVGDVFESTPNSGGYYHVTASYWGNGTVNRLSNAPGLPIITYNLDGEGRVNSITASTGQNPVSAATYNGAGTPTSVTLGSSDSDTFTYDPNTGRMTQYNFKVNNQSLTGNLGWNANGTLSSLSITDPFNSTDTQNCSYAHDDLARIASANCGSPWSQSFSADAFGNVNKNGTSSFQATYSPLTNRMTEIGSSTPTYDANGNVTNDFLHTYAWDAEGGAIIVDTIGLTYDALDRMVEQKRGSTYTEILYNPLGQKLALMNGQTLQKAFVPMPGNSSAVYNSSGLLYYGHPDWLGSIRLGSTPNRAMYFSLAYGPYGEPYAQSGTTNYSFTGMNQDTVSNLDDFPAREYGIQGRWPSPDPAGLTAVNLANPQSLNRYAYVSNTPLEAVDPMGLREKLNADGNPGGGGGGLGTDVGIIVDGVPLSNSPIFNQLLAQGIAAACPANNCSQIQVGQNGQWQVFVYGIPPGIAPFPSMCQLTGSICGETFGYWKNLPFYSGSLITDQTTIGPDPDWFHGKKAGCIAEGLKSTGKSLINYDEVKAIAAAMASGSMAPLAALLSGGTAADIAGQGADYVARNRAAQMTIRGALRSQGIKVFSARAVAKRATLLGKVFAAIGVALAAKSGTDQYKTCLTF
jgi:RHS repeat-associated protein